jgi:hypothetical protein
MVGKISNDKCLCLNEEMTQESRQLYQDYGTAIFRQISMQVNNQRGKMVQDLGDLSCEIIRVTQEEYKINFGY